jgi:hypothetical protein
MLTCRKPHTLRHCSTFPYGAVGVVCIGGLWACGVCLPKAMLPLWRWLLQQRHMGCNNQACETPLVCPSMWSCCPYGQLPASLTTCAEACGYVAFICNYMKRYEEWLHPCRLLAGRPPPVDASMHVKRDEGCPHHLWGTCVCIYIHIYIYTYMYIYIYRYKYLHI